MRILFCGTPAFALPSFEQLLEWPGSEIVGVFTQPDRPGGRGQDLRPSPVKQAALARAIPVYQPEKIRSPESQELLERLAPDCAVIIAYGQIIPARLLGIPRLGWINLHGSLLPRYRGAAPVHWAIANGETSTGVTTMRIDAGMDTGGMLLSRRVEIAPGETAPELAARLALAGAPLVRETLAGLASGALAEVSQDPAQASYAPMLKKEDGRILWSRTATEIYNRMRGFTPWPGSYSTFRGQSCHLLGQPVSNGAGEKTAAGPPGTLESHGGDLLVSCGRATVLRLVYVKLEGRKQTTAAEFAIGARLTPGERFGEH